jgi:ubiquitin-protein ligase
VNIVRERRLQSDFQAVRAACLVSRHRIVLEESIGKPPEAYHLLFRCVGLTAVIDGEAIYAEQHKVFIQFPPLYPALAPVIRVMTPLLHPHVWANGVVCLGSWRPSEKLDSVLQRVGEILIYAPSALNWRSVANDDAAAWARHNSDRFPLDQPLFTSIPSQMLYPEE